MRPKRSWTPEGGCSVRRGCRIRDCSKRCKMFDRLSCVRPFGRTGELESASDDQVLDAFYDWRGTWARTKQLPPDGDWTTWVVAGRAWGKTLAGSMWVHERALEHPGRWIALVARTPADARDYAVEGPGGILRNVHPRERPMYEPSKRRITWPNRSWADQLRGFSGDTAWLDEMAKFVNARYLALPPVRHA
jgi:phage terminase large subunit-like protein